jgi:4-alpha-glucanotransferase
MKYNRSAGILLHPTSLPGPDGIGDIGPEAYRWVNFIKNTGATLWQVLPLGPTGYGDSPYQCFSAFAGNPYLVNPSLLMDEDLLNAADLADRPKFADSYVDFGSVINWKVTILQRAYHNFIQLKPAKLVIEYETFKHEEAEWLDDFALFMAIKESYGGASWEKWSDGLRKRYPESIAEFQVKHADQIDSHKFRQFLFFRQWLTLKKYANENGVTIIGDIPIFVSQDSSDAWANPELFFFDKDLKPTVVAGVPPDYFSKTGQLWGNPLYNWKIHKKTGYAWWLKRIKATLRFFDIIRLDHFRGFAGYWEVPAGNLTAEIGRWVPGPGVPFFQAIKDELGDLPIIAEDLGEITPDVFELRDKFELPGMKICQFAFGGDPEEPFLPHNYPVNCVAYSGTHDNDTALGWYKTAPEKERDFCRRYLGRDGKNISWDIIRVVWSSVASTVLAPLQDFLSLDGEARMNFPGHASGNWSWRVTTDKINTELMQKIQEINYLYNRSTLKYEEKAD